MGYITGVNASLITNVEGIPSSNITRVGPISASSIGLGGGGSTPNPTPITLAGPFKSPDGACGYGGGGIGLFFDLNQFYSLGTWIGVSIYNNPDLTDVFNGNNLWWYLIEIPVPSFAIFIELQIDNAGTVIDNQDVC